MPSLVYSSDVYLSIGWANATPSCHSVAKEQQHRNSVTVDRDPKRMQNYRRLFLALKSTDFPITTSNKNEGVKYGTIQTDWHELCQFVASHPWCWLVNFIRAWNPERFNMSICCPIISFCCMLYLWGLTLNLTTSRMSSSIKSFLCILKPICRDSLQLFECRHFAETNLLCSEIILSWIHYRMRESG